MDHSDLDPERVEDERARVESAARGFTALGIAPSLTRHRDRAIQGIVQRDVCRASLGSDAAMSAQRFSLPGSVLHKPQKDARVV